MESIAKLDTKLRSALDILPAKQSLVLGYSGGCDSSVLLHALKRFRPELRLRAVHVHHGMQRQADQFVAHCEHVCQQLGVRLDVLEVQAAAPSGNREAWAREQRYRLLDHNMAADEALVLAHHQRDQAETILLNLLRGSGLEGLAAMPPQRRWQGRMLYRPLLSVSVDDLRAWAAGHALRWIEDPSNQELVQDRNYIRHQVLPLLDARFAGASANLARSAQLLGEQLEVDSVPASRSLAVSELLAMSESDRRLRLRKWLRALNLPAPRYRMWPQIWSQLLQAEDDREPCVCWPGAELRRYRAEIYAMTPGSAVQSVNWRNLPDSGQRPWPMGGSVHWSAPMGSGLRISTVFGGEQLRIHGMNRRLKKLFQQSGVPPWERGLLPVLWREDECLAVADRWRADQLQQMGILWRFDPA